MSNGRTLREESELKRKAMLEMAHDLRSRVSPSTPPATTSPAQYQRLTDFGTLDLYQEMRKVRAIADVVRLESPFFRIHDGQSGATCDIDGRTYTNFASYDYLGLNGEPSVGAAAKAAIDTYGTSVSASRPTAGDRPLHRRLERRIADHYQAEDALCFVSGHATNVSVIGELLGNGDLILFDALCHNSIALGTKLSPAARQSFPHNDMAALRAILETSRRKFNRVLIVVEGLYSMDGDVAPLPELIDLKTRYGAWLMVDEAHSLGVLGETGRGVFEHFGLSPQAVDIWMGTLSKALSACGGYIAGCRTLIEILRFHASAFMYSVGMAPPVAAAALAALDLMQDEPQRVAALHRIGERFVTACRVAGLNTGASIGRGIGIVIVGDSLKTAKLAENLFARDINTVPVTYPAVPMRAARLRFFLTAKHTDDQVDTTVAAVREELDKLEASKFGLATTAAAAIASIMDAVALILLDASRIVGGSVSVVITGA